MIKAITERILNAAISLDGIAITQEDKEAVYRLQWECLITAACLESGKTIQDQVYPDEMLQLARSMAKNQSNNRMNVSLEGRGDVSCHNSGSVAAPLQTTLF